MFTYTNNSSITTDTYHLARAVKSFDPVWIEYDNRSDAERNISYFDWITMTYGIVVGPSFGPFMRGPFVNSRYYPIAIHDVYKAEIFLKKFPRQDSLDDLSNM